VHCNKWRARANVAFNAYRAIPNSGKASESRSRHPQAPTPSFLPRTGLNIRSLLFALQSPQDVVTVCLRALMANDEPWENHGCEILIAYSSTYAKEKDPVHYSTPDAMYKKLREDPDTEYVLGIEDFRLVDVLAPLSCTSPLM
jgi:hypothetical protein